MKRIIFFLLVSLPFIGFAQPVQFKKDSIPLVEGKVVFNVNLTANLNKEKFRNAVYRYLTNVLNPYSGKILINNEGYTLCKITDYINIIDNALQKFGMYMVYTLKLKYKKDVCELMIKDIYFIEKRDYETREKSNPKLNISKFSGKEIMIDQNYNLMFIKRVSERITEAAIKRINEILKDLNTTFVKNSNEVRN